MLLMVCVVVVAAAAAAAVAAVVGGIRPVRTCLVRALFATADGVSSAIACTPGPRCAWPH